MEVLHNGKESSNRSVGDDMCLKGAMEKESSRKEGIGVISSKAVSGGGGASTGDVYYKQMKELLQEESKELSCNGVVSTQDTEEPEECGATDLVSKVGAQTINRVTGIHVCGLPPYRLEGIANARVKWNEVDGLLFDEIGGPVTADFLDWMDIHVMKLRNQSKVLFGGIPLVCFGDIGQLAPVRGESVVNRNVEAMVVKDMVAEEAEAPVDNGL